MTVNEMYFRPIELAPKDGTEVLVYEPGELPAMAKWIQGEGYALWSYADELMSDICPQGLNPTHYMPIVLPQ